MATLSVMLVLVPIELLLAGEQLVTEVGVPATVERRILGAHLDRRVVMEGVTGSGGQNGKSDCEESVSGHTTSERELISAVIGVLSKPSGIVIRGGLLPRRVFSTGTPEQRRTANGDLSGPGGPPSPRIYVLHRPRGRGVQIEE